MDNFDLSHVQPRLLVNTARGSSDPHGDQHGDMFPDRGLMLSSNNIMDVYHHFGCNIESINGSKDTSPHYHHCRQIDVGVRVTVDCMPSGVHQMSSLKCDKHAPSVIMTRGTYLMSPLDVSTVSRGALWVLPLLTVPGNNHQVSLIIQKMLWMTGSHIKVDIQRNDQGRWSICDQTDYEIIRKHLGAFSCTKLTIKDCLLQLLLFADEQSWLAKDSVTYQIKWWEALTDLGLFNPDCKQAKPVCKKVIYKPSSLTSAGIPPNKYQSEVFYKNTCSKDLQASRDPLTDPLASKDSLSYPLPIYQHILLLIVYNNPFYTNIPVIEHLYRPFSPRILYCGPTFTGLDHPSLVNYDISFITYAKSTKEHLGGMFSTECTTMAMEMGFHNEHGVLTLHDDVLMFPQRLQNLPLSHIWLHALWKSQSTGNILTNILEWSFFKQYRSNILTIFREIRKLSHTSPVAKKCYKQHVDLQGPWTPAGGYSDIHFIPSSIYKQFHEIAQTYIRNHVPFEVAIPNIIRCLVNPSDVRLIPGRLVEGGSVRDKPWETLRHIINNETIFMHPVKWSGVSSKPSKIQEFLCETVVDYVFKPASDQPAMLLNEDPAWNVF